MNADIKLLELDKIIARVVDRCETDRGKALAAELAPENDVDLVETMLSETMEAKTMIERFDSAPMGGVLLLDEALKRARLFAMLSIEELQRVSSLQSAIEANLRFIRKIRSLDLPTKHVGHYFDELLPLPQLKREIDLCIDDRGFVVDSASDELGQVRRKLHATERKITEKMEGLLRSEGQMLTDSIITIRNNRLVLPVKTDYRNVFKGIIHDQSASRETVFMEPLACVELNNAVSSLQVQEQAEVEKILYRLSGMVGEHHAELATDFELLTQLDILFAKAKYALQTDSVKPELADDIHLILARHPLIDPKAVVANTIRYGQYKAIIITGPNTGGKTVALKTLGLCALMAQTGLLVPCKEGSKLPVFSGIYADIGDEQSIEQSLSTFSSHITKIIDILAKAEAGSLILLDELGSGTDPKEGASLAISIMDHLRNRDVRVMVSTHYPELKIYAFDKEDVQNASVEFDIQTLKPTYRLLQGIPGTSNAIDIASRLGLEASIIEHAKHVSLTFDNQTMNLIRKLERQSLELQGDIEAAEAESARYVAKQAALEQELANHKIAQNKAMASIEEQKKAVIEQARKDALALIEELDQMKKSATFKEHELAKLKHDIKQLSETNIDYKKIDTTAIQVGDVVNVIPFQRSGIVMKAMGSGNFQIQMGTITSIFHQNQLEYAGKKPIKSDASKVSLLRQSNPKVELDLRGMRYEEAMTRLDKFVDDCLIDNLEFAYIIHGYGTGALRKGVLDYVKSTSQIASYRAGGAGEGGSGVTVVTFR